MITPAEKEVILAKDLAYALHLPDAPPDAVKTFVKALLSDDIATLQMLTRTKISIVKNSTVEDIKSTCDTACFIAGTLVETAKGLIPIEQIGFGDLIWSREEFGEDYAYKPVVTTKATDNQQLVEIIAENPQGQQEVYKTTLEHPFYVENIGWLKASLLSPEMRLLDRDGMASLRVVSQQVLDNYATVYNIMVDDHHTYHIGEFGIWVHNAKCCDLSNVKVGDVHPQTSNKVLSVKKGSNNSLNFYENPGHHDPKGKNNNSYKNTKSVLPDNHLELWENSIQAKDGDRWAKEIIKGKTIYHRFEYDPNYGTFHWNGSTNGKTLSGQDRKLSLGIVPSEIRGK